MKWNKLISERLVCIESAAIMRRLYFAGRTGFFVSIKKYFINCPVDLLSAYGDSYDDDLISLEVMTAAFKIRHRRLPLVPKQP